MEIFKLLGTIAIENDSANKAIDDTSVKTSSFSEKLENGIATVTKWSAAVGAAVTAAGAAVMKFAQNSASVADNVDKMSQKIGISRVAYQELDFICSQSGMSVDTLQTGLKTLTSQMQAAGDGTETAAVMFEKLGVSIYDSTGQLKDQETMMWETFTALQNMENQTEKAALASDLFGRSGTELMPMLNGATGSIEAMREKAHDLGLVLGDELVNSGVSLTDTMDQTKRSISAVMTNLGATFMPVVENVCNYIIEKMPVVQEKVSEIGEKIEERLGNGAGLIETVTGKISELKEWFANIYEYAAGNLHPIIEDVSTAFENASGKIQPLIDRLKDYFTSGEAAEDITNGIKAAIDWLAEAYTFAKDSLQWFIDVLPDYVTNGELVEDLTNGIKDAAEFLKEKFDLVKETIQPLIEKFEEYVSSGELVEDITDGIKSACDWLVGAYEDVVDAAVAVSDWCTEHQTTLENIAIVVGSIATAFGVMKASMVLTKAITVAWTAVSGAATTATTAFGTAIAFLTSPIGVLTAAIAGIIAICALLIKNWDEIKAWAINLWESIKETFTGIKDSVVEKVTELKEKASEIFNGIKSVISDTISAAKDTVSEKLNNMKSAFEEHGGGIKGIAAAAVEGVKGYYSAGFTFIDNLTGGKLSDIATKFTDKMDAVKSTVSEKLEAVKTKFTDIFESAKTTVSNAIEKIKGFFKFDWSLPDLKLPHFGVTGNFSLNPLSFPRFSVEWYDKAVDNPMLLNEATIFGASNGKLLGGGETKPEVVSGVETLMGMIGNVVEAKTAAQNAKIISLLSDILDAILDGNTEMLRALLTKQVLELDKREVGRVVRSYA